MLLRNLLSSIFVLLLLPYLTGQDTFSIVAVDPETGAVGAAGASCIDDDDCGGCGGVIIINDLIPGRGGMNSQAYACIPNINLNNGIAQLNLGNSPQEALDYVLANDQCGFFDNTYRQYGIVDLDSMGQARSVAYTGVNCDAYANHIVGPNYAIQGNILLGQSILDDMEAGFLNTQGTLAEKLMAALQGANVPGADTRCLDEGVSSLSAFVRVALPGDAPDNFFLDINVKSTPLAVEPIDSVQTLFDEWLVTAQKNVDQTAIGLEVYPNPTDGEVIFQWNQSEKNNLNLEIFDLNGKLIHTASLNGNKHIVQDQDLPHHALYWFAIKDLSGNLIKTGKLVKN